ncbi:hypothetical protein NEOLI_001316 [Neolecta irregularis DAH-3]|uniref:Uncharacterized protein n=1 Tax=Neolecta irregularis (strain DAH-3) TaxID=1198029 RepID=A0A1U7LQ31_NEOID|nr:hypothetical protein NEOLI_001316 [Neolecta irregularis DAH-3]|eukprot:OLL24652.1 hypothetical protein NEOLI_001316 [Neolecta irregularis DAH-3]
MYPQPQLILPNFDMSSMNIDASLDELTPEKRKNVQPVSSRGPQRQNQGRQPRSGGPYQYSRSDTANIDGSWKHDKFGESTSKDLFQRIGSVKLRRNPLSAQRESRDYDENSLFNRIDLGKGTKPVKSNRNNEITGRDIIARLNKVNRVSKPQKAPLRMPNSNNHFSIKGSASHGELSIKGTSGSTVVIIQNLAAGTIAPDIRACLWVYYL